MKVEFTGRFSDKSPKTEAEREAEEIQRLIDPEFIPEKKVRYSYDPITIELNDVSAWIRLDREHTQLNTYDKDVFYIIKLPYLLFSEIYEDLSGEKISVVQVTTATIRPSIQVEEERENSYIDEEEE